MSADFAGFGLDKDEARMEVYDPNTGEKMPGVWIDVLSSDSKEFQRRQRETNKKWVRRRSRFNVDEAGLDRAVDATKGWGGFEWEGVPLPYSPENARKVYERQVWLKDDVVAFSHERSHFLGN